MCPERLAKCDFDIFQRGGKREREICLATANRKFPIAVRDFTCFVYLSKAHKAYCGDIEISAYKMLSLRDPNEYSIIQQLLESPGKFQKCANLLADFDLITLLSYTCRGFSTSLRKMY